MWVPKILLSPVKIRIFCPKKSKFGPKMAFLFILGQALPAHSVGGFGARAVSRKTPIYFITNLDQGQQQQQLMNMNMNMSMNMMKVWPDVCFRNALITNLDQENPHTIGK